MNTINRYTRQQINDSKWNLLIEQCDVSLVYAYTWYLDGMCQEWQALVYGDYEAVLPLPVRKKWGLLPYVFQPFFIQRLGVFGNLGLQSQLLSKLPKSIVLCHWHMNEIEKSEKRINLILKLSLPYYKLEENYSKDAKKNLRKLALCDYKEAHFKDCIALYKNTWGKLNTQITDEVYKQFEHVCGAAMAHNKLKCYQIELNGELLAQAIWLFSGNRIHNVCAAITPSGKRMGAMHGLVDFAIKMHANSHWIFDFEGSEIPSVASFYNKFNPEAEHYSLVKKWLPGWF